jgi:hypothetical protein
LKKDLVRILSEKAEFAVQRPAKQQSGEQGGGDSLSRRASMPVGSGGTVTVSADFEQEMERLREGKRWCAMNVGEIAGRTCCVAKEKCLCAARTIG